MLWLCSEKKVMILTDTSGKILILFLLVLKHLGLYTVSHSSLNTCFYGLAEFIQGIFMCNLKRLWKYL